MSRKYRVVSYTANDKMSTMISENYTMALILSRFGIKLGFKDMTIAQVCESQQIDCSTLMAVANMLLAEHKSIVDPSLISLPALVEYLNNSHKYFVEYKLPAIRHSLNAAIPASDPLSVAVMNYYDEYVAEVEKHMKFEEGVVFKYVERLLNGEEIADFNIEMFSDSHQSMDSKLAELKNILIKYYPVPASYELSSALYEIFACEEDLLSHSDIEDYLLIPAIRELEGKNHR